MIFVEGELSAISGRAVRRVDMLIVPGGGDLDGVRVVAAGGESAIWALLLVLSLDDVDVAGTVVGKLSEDEMTEMTFCCSTSVTLELGDEFSVDIIRLCALLKEGGVRSKSDDHPFSHVLPGCVTLDPANLAICCRLHR